MSGHSLGDVLLLWFNIFVSWLEAIYRLFVSVPPKSVKGRIVLVTGASGGIGRQIAVKFSQQGAKIVLWDINKQGLEDTANEITASGGFVKAYVCDVSKYDDVKRVSEQVRQEVGDVYILVNNAGILNPDGILDLEEEQIRRTMDINILAHFWTVKEFLPHMIESNEGHIVSIASSAGLFGTPIITDYCASKFAVVGFTEALGEEMRRYKKTGIHTTTVCPLFVNTKLLDMGAKITFHSGSKPPMEPDFVADQIVQGTLRNKRMIYLPSSLQGYHRLRGLMNWKMVTLLLDFHKIGFYKKHN